MRTKLCALAILCVPLAPPLPAQETDGTKRFRPEEHFPSPSLLYFSVPSVSGLQEGFAGTLPGRLISHPGWRRALARPLALLDGLLEREWAPVVEVTGKSPPEILELVQGEFALTVRGLSLGIPEAAVAVEVGEGEDELLGVLTRLQALYEKESGHKVEQRRVGSVEASVWATPVGPLFQAVLGTHLVLALSSDLFRSIVAAYEGKAEREPLSAGRLHKGLEEVLAMDSRQLILEIDLGAIQRIALGFLAGSSNEEEIRTVLETSGLRRITSFGYALGFREGGAEGIVHLGLADGAGDFLQLIERALPPLDPEAVEASLARIPGSASQIQLMRFDPGRFLRGLDGLLRRSIPELGDELDAGFRELEAMTGISVEKDVLSLGDITLYGFSVDPPAGGLFADRLALARTEALAPYWKLAGKIGKFFDSSFTELEARGAKVEYLSVARHERSETLFETLLEGGEPEFETSPELTTRFIATWLLPVITRAELEGGWTVVSTLPQAVVRYVDFYAKDGALSADADLRQLTRAQVKGASFLSVSRGGTSFLSAYNTVLSLSSTSFVFSVQPFLQMLGVDFAQLPPAEAFLGDVKPGYLRLAMDPTGFTLHGHRALESSGGALLTGMGALGIGSALVVPGLLRTQRRATTTICANNLKGLYVASQMYFLTTGHFPHSPKGSLATLQLLADAAELELQPESFFCPEGEEGPPALVDGKIVLTEETCSYEAAPWNLQPTADAILFYDKKPHHDGQRNVVFSDGTVRLMGEDEFQERLRAHRERFGSSKN